MSFSNNKNKSSSENKVQANNMVYTMQAQQTNKKIFSEQNKLTANKQKLAILQKKAAQLRSQKAEKISKLDDLNRQLKQYKQHQQMLPLIKQLRQHYKKLKQKLMQNGGQQNMSDFEDDDIDVDQMSYQQLLELGQKIGKVSKGISQQQFNQLQRQQCMTNQQCSICQDDLMIGAQCIKLKCGHMFDIDCLKQWLKMEKICPLCKIQLV